MLSLFCAGGLYAYVREALRLQRLIVSGMVVQATILKKEKIDSGSESVIHYLITYKFIDNQGETIVHEQDMNSDKYFNNLSTGDKIEILYQKELGGDSYPLSQIRTDRKIAQWFSAGIILFWLGMTALLI